MGVSGVESADTQQPALNGGRLLSLIVVADKMNFKVLRHGGVDRVQELEKPSDSRSSVVVPSGASCRPLHIVTSLAVYYERDKHFSY